MYNNELENKEKLEEYRNKYSEKSPREQAIEWWNKLTGLEKGLRCPVGINQSSLTGRGIEEIWKKETQQKSEIELQADEVERIGFENLKVKEPQVDFEMLKIFYK